MKKLLKTFIFFTFIGNIIMTQSNDSNHSIYDIPLNKLNGESFSLSDSKGKKILIVNVASKCGYTSQYKDLQNLYDKHSDKLEIIAIPCNDYGAQESGSNSDIKDFCEINYGVSFTIASKQNIKSSPTSGLYHWLSSPEQNGWNSSLPSWNFCKYIIDENGKLTHFLRSGVNPSGKKIKSIIIS